MENIKNDTKACTGSECKVKNPSGKYCPKDIKEFIKLYTQSEDKSS